MGTLLGDTAYSDVREAEQAGADSVAKVAPVTNAGRFPKTDFDIDLAAGRVTCPAGATTSDARPSQDHKGRPATTFYFAASTCAPCPLRDQCTTARSGRTIVAGHDHERIQAARAAQGQPRTKGLLRRRRKVEARSTISGTSGCEKPATAAGGKLACKPCLPQPSLVSSASLCSTCSKQLPLRPPEPGQYPAPPRSPPLGPSSRRFRRPGPQNCDRHSSRG